MNFRIPINITFFLVFSFWVYEAALAKTPTRITSDIIDIKRNSQIMDFYGHVVVKKDADTMFADKMTVFYEEKGGEKEKEKKEEKVLTDEEKEKLMQKRRRDKVQKKEEAKSTELKRIDAYDNVKVSSAEFVATGDKGHYEPKLEQFILEENVVVNNGKSIANGEKFIYNLKTKKGNFVGKTKQQSPNADNRVVVTIGSEDLKGKKKTKKENE